MIETINAIWWVICYIITIPIRMVTVLIATIFYGIIQAFLTTKNEFKK